MANAKVLLKQVRDLIKQQKWNEAAEGAQEVINLDKNSHQAHVFLGFVHTQKNRLDEAEKAYETATALKPNDAEAWKGLVKLYERQGSMKLAKYKQVALKLAAIYGDQEDMYRSQEAIDKFVDFANAQGSRLQFVEALDVKLPSSPIYSTLEGRFPHPAKTYETIAQILEVEEKKRINTLIGERRTRIGARISEVTVEVNREVLRQSKIGEIYEQLILWLTDDDTRRQYEEKLLRFHYDLLLVLAPGPEKETELGKVQELAKGMVIIKHPYRLAWEITINWQDYKDIKNCDIDILSGYCARFPETDLYKVLVAFLTSAISPFPKLDLGTEEHNAESADREPKKDSEDSESSDDDADGGAPTSIVPLTAEDRLLSMVEGASSTESMIAYRLLGEFYRHLEEHESNVELMRKAMRFMVEESQKSGKVFINTNQAFMLYLGTALVFYQSPRNHGEAKLLFDKVLEVEPSSTPALIGIGLIFEEEEEYDSAIDFLSRALEREGSNLRVKAEVAWLFALRGEYARGKADLESMLVLMQKKGAASKELLAQTQYRLGVCIWNLDSSKAARKSRTGAYAHFLNALKNDFSYAPAYTSLGIYYAEYAKDKKRAQRCFMKAVELSPSEVESAERLARSFADDGDWDRVELVAQRVVDSGKVRPPPGSKRKGISWPFSALGVAEMNKQDYTKAIDSFQAASRMSPRDYHSWVGLGESYYNSGRYTSAFKALRNAQSLEADGDSIESDSWFTKYLLANVYHEIGEFDDAIKLYQEVSSARPDEDGVSIALMQTQVESALSSVEKGYFGKASELATATISFALTVPGQASQSFNFWKAVGDACSIFSLVQSRADEFPTNEVRDLIGPPEQHDVAYDIMHDIDGVGKGVIFAKGLFSEDERLGVDLTRSLHATILAHKRAVHLSSNDAHAQAVAYYNLGWAEHRAHGCLPIDLRSKTSRYHKAAVRSFKRAIELEAGNAEFWNSLGVVTSEINPSVAQHAFVRSLHLNERNPHAWTNLGALALLQNDFQLANEAFTRAQSTDPDYAHAWLGQAFVALLYGDAKEALGHFTHAMDISDASSVFTRRRYAVSLFDHVLTNPPDLNDISLIHPLFALNQLQCLDPQDLAYGHLSTLFQERTEDYVRSIGVLENVCEHLAASYEATESLVSLGHFALAKTDLARTYLAARKFGQAAECGEMALQLSSDDSGNELTLDQRRKARLSAHLTVGLAQYFDNNIQDALRYFEAALHESNNNPDAVCVLAQILWASGAEEAREKARNSLFEVIENDPGHVQSVLLLGAIALLDNDDESLEAVTAELQALRTGEKVTSTEHSQIGQVLRAVAASSVDAAESEIVTSIQTDVMLHPQLPFGWSRLAQLSDQEYPAAMTLSVALKAVPPRGDLSAANLAGAYSGTGSIAHAQTAVFVAPWSGGGWESLAEAVAS